MEINEGKARDINEPGISKQEISKIKELSGLLKNEAGENRRMSLGEARETVSGRLEGRKPFLPDETGLGGQIWKHTEGMKVEDKLNKKQDISFGATGCEGFCQKVHDGTRVHGTY